MINRKSLNYLILINVAAITLLLGILVATVFATPVFADEATTGEEIPKDAESYTLTYPDGTVITENEQGEPQRRSRKSQLRGNR